MSAFEQDGEYAWVRARLFAPFLSVYKWHIPGRDAVSRSSEGHQSLGVGALVYFKLTTAVRLTPTTLPGVSVVPGDKQNTERAREREPERTWFIQRIAKEGI